MKRSTLVATANAEAKAVADTDDDAAAQASLKVAAWLDAQFMVRR